MRAIAMRYAKVTWRGATPAAADFNDIYFAHEQGPAETKYIFLCHSDLPQRWLNNRNFVISETGFGTGLNFLVTWQAWQKTNSSGHLHFISAEKFPLSPDDF